MNYKKSKKIIICTLDDSYKWFKSENWLKFIDSDLESIIVIKGGPYSYKNKTLYTVEKQMTNHKNISFLTLNNNDNITEILLKKITERIEDDLYIFFANNEPLYYDMKPKLEKIYAGVFYNDIIDFRTIDKKLIKPKTDYMAANIVSGLISDSKDTGIDDYEEISDEDECVEDLIPEIDEDLINNKNKEPKDENLKNNSNHKQVPNEDFQKNKSSNVSEKEEKIEEENNEENSTFHKTIKKFPDKVYAGSDDTGSKIREIEKKIFAEKFDIKELNLTRTPVSESKAKLVCDLQLRCIQDIDYLIKGIKERNFTFEQYIKIINLFLITDEIKSLKTNLCSTFAISEHKLDIKPNAYKYIKTEIEYYKDVCNLLYQGDKWDR